ncbi:NFACT family protein [Clostridium swellfunianum]|uniref:Rqc2 family fibronectin-binding protein n=1 Tax=Clostridium swellfunianum TaxID=1367462 RepID=UPI0020305E26|nr:NFACT RNA binding domain-containing protein [Clostridium swellfunianum]MCM0650393.1 NFACT family protein [Clostridium swellfunianum]
MPLDGIYIYSLAEEFKNKLVGCRVDKISQPEKDELILSLRGDRTNLKLLISASSTYPKIHLTNINKPNPVKAPMFCMVLRKYLGNARVTEISQISTDRIIAIDFESADELGFYSIYSLIVEIMGRHSNITLVRKRDNIVIDSIKHMTPEINSYRSLYPGINYVYPPESIKLNPFDFSFEDFNSYVDSNNIKFDYSIFSKMFTGVSTQFSKSISEALTINNIELNSFNLKNIYSYILMLFESLKKGEFHFNAYYDASSVKDFYCKELYQLENLNKRSYDSPSALIEEFYHEKDKTDRLNAKSYDLQKIVNNNIDRCNKKLEILKKTLKECEEKDHYRIFGELLTANIYNIKKGDKSVKTLNYYEVNEEYIEIKLDENKSPSENIQAYFKKYNKLKKSAEMAEIQINTTEQELDYLQSVLTNIKNVESYDEIDDIRRELTETGYIRFKKEDKKKSKTSKPHHFLSSDGAHIYVGKNNIQNDSLTLKFADKQDIWMHTKNIPGSHVIIKNAGKISDKTLEEAATLAAFYSKGKDSTKVPVDYTEVRNVKKPSGSKPGMVIYYTNKTIYIDPKKLELQKIE